MKIANSQASAFASFKTQAEAGDASAQCNLGACYANGMGTAQNYKEAVRWFLAAAEQNYAPAATNLAICYEMGYGVAKDNAKAEYWRSRAKAIRE